MPAWEAAKEVGLAENAGTRLRGLALSSVAVERFEKRSKNTRKLSSASRDREKLNGNYDLGAWGGEVAAGKTLESEAYGRETMPRREV